MNSLCRKDLVLMQYAFGEARNSAAETFGMSKLPDILNALSCF